MIIRPNKMTPAEVQKQVNQMSIMKRGFNQTPEDIKDNVNFGFKRPKNDSSSMNEALDLRKKVSSLKNVRNKF